MSKKANPTTIGLFVVIGLTLGIAGLVTFGSGKWFKHVDPFIVYFDSSVRGLNPGSAVRVGGVKVGTVREVLIHYNQAKGDVFMPVIIEVDNDLLNSKTDRTFHLGDKEMLQDLVDKGLRARLQAESLVTGVLYVDLSVLPDPPPATYHQVVPRYIEIPSAPNEIKLLMDNLAHLDFRSLSEKLDTVLASLNDELRQLQMEEISTGLTNLLASLNAVVDSPELRSAVTKLDQTLEETRLLASELRTKVDPLGEGVEQTLVDTRTTVNELGLAIEDLRTLLAPDAPLKRELVVALDQISNAAQSISDLADYLSRNPKALLSGRKLQDTKP